MRRVQSGNALARFHICKQATVQWRRTEIIAMPIVQNLCDFCIKTTPICWIFSSYVSWVVSYIHLDIQAVFCRCYVGLPCIASRGNAWGWFRCTAELYRALINALVLGSTDWSHCLNAYSMLFKLPANLNSSTRWLTLIFNGDTRPPTHPWTATRLCYTGRPICELVMTELSQCFLTCVV